MIQFLKVFSLLVCLSLHAQDAVLDKADSLVALGNYSKAIELYQNHNNPVAVNDKMARAFEAIGNYSDAVKYYEFAVNNNPDDAFLKYQLGKLLSRLKKYDQAKNVFTELINSDNQNPNYHYELGSILENTNDSLSIPTFQKVYHLDSNHQKAIFKLARHYLVKRAHDSVSFYVEQGLKTYPKNVELISLKAQNFYWKEHYSHAVIWFEKLIALGESSEGIHEKLSFCYAQNSDYDLAIKQLKLALKYNPKNVDNIFRLGKLYLRNADYPNAETHMATALSMMDVPLDAEYTDLAAVYNHQKKYDQGIKALNLAIKENPDNEYAYFILAYTKDAFYADTDSKIKAYEQFVLKFPEGRFSLLAERRISELKKEQFLQED